MAEWKDLRNYEISVWTLQDSYITTLKSGDPLYISDNVPPAVVWPQARAQGQIQNGQMELNIDGTQTLSFDIPMYLFVNGQKIENPNWYDIHTQDYHKVLNNNEENITGNILTSMRKIKVIFNKWQNDAAVFEFIILKVQESHEQDNLVCHVECEGLAFHELGKVGYKRSLTTDEFNDDYYKWSCKTVQPSNPKSGVTYDYNSEEAKKADEPIANLQYWMTKAKIDPRPANNNDINPNKWYYEIKMAHTSLVHKINVYSNKIYEEGYVSNWTDDGVPVNYIETREKARLVDINESNLYNITQDLAEKFEVFCRYEYIYDTNYNIIGRIIVFYNNFLQEDQGVTTLMYPNSASKISREMDSTDISTKMFVRSVESDDLYLGTINMMDCDANYSKEDYILNFDYLHEIGTISNEQYKAIHDYEKAMRKLNEELVPLQGVWGYLQTLKEETDGKVTILKESIKLDEERITETGALMEALDTADADADGYITRDYRNPYTFPVLKDASKSKYDSYYIQLNSNEACTGIKPDSLKLFSAYHTTSTETKEYALSFNSFSLDTITSQNLRKKMSLDLPPNSVKKWSSDINYVYKCTVGSDGEIQKLPVPSDDRVGWIYRAKFTNAPSTAQTINIGTNDGNISVKHGSLIYCAPTGNNSYAWQTIAMPKTRYKQLTEAQINELKSSGNVSLICYDNGNDDNDNKYININTINGNTETAIRNNIKKMIFQLPDSPSENDAYKVLTANYPEGYAVAAGRWLYYQNGQWNISSTSSQPGNTSDKGYLCSGLYIGKTYNFTSGFYILTRITRNQINGLQSITYQASRKNASTNLIDYISEVKLVYYVNQQDTSYPSRPRAESNHYPATQIYDVDKTNVWTTFIPTPSDLTKIENYYYHCAWYVRTSQGTLKYIYETDDHVWKFKTTTSAANGVTDGYRMRDTTNKFISDKLAHADEQFLKPEEEVSGKFVYKDGVLDSVTGIYKMPKQGHYSSYEVLDTGISLSSVNSYSNINSKVNGTNGWSNTLEETDYPTDVNEKYVVIQDEHHTSNGNIVFSYTIKYYDNKGLVTDPSDKTQVYLIQPIFYLKTNSTIPSIPADNVTVYSDKAK